MLTTTHVSHLMTKNPITVSPNDTMEKVREIFESNEFHHLPVVENDKIVGIISTKEVLLLARYVGRKFDEKRNKEFLSSTLVAEMMQKEIVTIQPADSIYKALEKFNTGYFHSLPVVWEGELLGILTSTDLTRFLYTELKGERFLF